MDEYVEEYLFGVQYEDDFSHTHIYVDRESVILNNNFSLRPDKLSILGTPYPLSKSLFNSNTVFRSELVNCLINLLVDDMKLFPKNGLIDTYNSTLTHSISKIAYEVSIATGCNVISYGDTSNKADFEEKAYDCFLSTLLNVILNVSDEFLINNFRRILDVSYLNMLSYGRYDININFLLDNCISMDETERVRIRLDSVFDIVGIHGKIKSSALHYISNAMNLYGSEVFNLIKLIREEMPRRNKELTLVNDTNTMLNGNTNCIMEVTHLPYFTIKSTTPLGYSFIDLYSIVERHNFGYQSELRLQEPINSKIINWIRRDDRVYFNVLDRKE